MEQTTRYRQLQPEDRMTMAIMKQQGFSAQAGPRPVVGPLPIDRDAGDTAQHLYAVLAIALPPSASEPEMAAWHALAYAYLDAHRTS